MGHIGNIWGSISNKPGKRYPGRIPGHIWGPRKSTLTHGSLFFFYGLMCWDKFLGRHFLFDDTSGAFPYIRHFFAFFFRSSRCKGRRLHLDILITVLLSLPYIPQPLNTGWDVVCVFYGKEGFFSLWIPNILPGQTDQDFLCFRRRSFASTIFAVSCICWDLFWSDNKPHCSSGTNQSCVCVVVWWWSERLP